jgi:AcrR family transcriptional regulator
MATTNSRKIRSSITNETLLFERRKRIVQESAKILAKHGYQAAGMREIAKTVDLTVGGLYRYIGAKSDIVYLILKWSLENQIRLIEKMKAQTEGLDPVKALENSVELYFANVDDIQDVYNSNNHILATVPKKDRRWIFDSEERIVAYFTELLERGIEAGQFHVEDPIFEAHRIVILANSWANRRWFLRKRYTLKDFTEKGFRSILVAIGAGDIGCKDEVGVDSAVALPQRQLGE